MHPGPGTTLYDRLVRLAFDRGRRLSLLIVVGYVAALLGVAIAFLGLDRPGGDVVAVGLALLFLAFVALFVVSVSLASLDQG